MNFLINCPLERAHFTEAAALAAEPEWTESTKWTESREVYGVPLARSEGDESLQAAPLAADAHAAVLEQTTTQVLVHLALHEARQASRFFGALAELRPVRRERPVEHRLFRAVSLVGARCLVRVPRCRVSHSRGASGSSVPARAAPFRCVSPGSWSGARPFQHDGRHPARPSAHARGAGARQARAGDELGPLGARVVAETFVRMLKRDADSHLNASPAFQPSLVSTTDFTVADLLVFAGVT